MANGLETLSGSSVPGLARKQARQRGMRFPGVFSKTISEKKKALCILLAYLYPSLVNLNFAGRLHCPTGSCRPYPLGTEGQVVGFAPRLPSLAHVGLVSGAGEHSSPSPVLRALPSGQLSSLLPVLGGQLFAGVCVGAHSLEGAACSAHLCAVSSLGAAEPGLPPQPQK